MCVCIASAAYFSPALSCSRKRTHTQTITRSYYLMKNTYNNNNNQTETNSFLMLTKGQEYTPEL